jgi:hypothetical protein
MGNRPIDVGLAESHSYVASESAIRVSLLCDGAQKLGLPLLHTMVAHGRRCASAHVFHRQTPRRTGIPPADPNRHGRTRDPTSRHVVVASSSHTYIHMSCFVECNVCGSCTQNLHRCTLTPKVLGHTSGCKWGAVLQYPHVLLGK